MKITFLVLLFMSANSSYSQDTGGISLTAEGADGTTRSGTVSSDGDGDSSDSNSRNQNNRVKGLSNYLPVGVQQFSKIYPKTHFRFVSGDILSANFFEVTGLFVEAVGDDPLNTAIERTSTVERHAGLFTFLSTATIGAHAINGIEQKINNKLGIVQTNKRITQLKNFAGLNVLAGVYGYVAVDAALKGKSKDEVIQMLLEKETFAAALSMHLAFMGADKFVEYGKGVKKNLSFMNKVIKNPQALRIAQAHGFKSGLSLYKDILGKTGKINELRKDLAKAKVTLGVAQPELIPVIAGQTIVEWTIYYTVAKVWNSMIHDHMLSFLNSYDQGELSEDMDNVLCYASNQGALHYDEKVLKAAEVIKNNTQQLYALMYAPLIDKQLKIAQKLMKLDYLESLNRRYFQFHTIQERNKFLISLLEKNHEMYELNLVFVNSLLDTLNSNGFDIISKKEFKNSLQANYDSKGKSEYIPPYSLSLSAAVREHRRKNRDFFQKEFDNTLSLINKGVKEVVRKNGDDSSEFLKYLSEDITELEDETAEIQQEASRIAGMSFDQIEASHTKYKIDPITNKSLGTFEEMPKPESVYELILVQKKYTRLLEDIANNEDTKLEIKKIQNENEFSLYFQVKSWESIGEIKVNK